ncbi:GNAT family N-acetyltransferase [Allosphingosinicella indica]|uniref:Protein N-acetyltransferase, RimJ/RimL family n=1 Tax=Allosphingosinicella indica TaxID=941907 RepID=A0A1X7G0P0_9SPHN|nr:GNAT family N-acetyltransferase [Allosphingosinicella indica]SMF61557.1 Protein N-acetyltransferase, RimJ/RimL family [Allosphingosinicella indica]
MFARTPRLLLRPGWAEDAPALAAAIADEAIVRNLASPPWPYSLNDAEAWLTRDRDAHEPALLVFRRTAGAPQLIGAAGFGPMPDGRIELGYWIARRHWGLGYATEAAEAMIANARDTLRLNRLYAGHFTDNPASGRVLEKLGFVATGQIAQRYSVARRGAAPCREFVRDLTAAAAPCDQEAACRQAA